MLVGFITTYPISKYHQPNYVFESGSGEVYFIQHYNDKVCQWLAACRWFFPGSPVSSTNKTDRHEITEILLKGSLKTITIRSGASIIVELSKRNASMHLTIYQVYVCKTQYAMQILKGKYLVYNNLIRS
jgi:hypothetical protein